MCAVYLIRHRCTDDSESGIEGPQSRASNCVVGQEFTAAGALKNQLARGAHRAAIPETIGIIHFPALSLSDRIPGQQRRRPVIGIDDGKFGADADHRKVAPPRVFKVLKIVLVGGGPDAKTLFDRGDIHESGTGIERHRRKGVCAGGARPDQHGAVLVTDLRRFNRPPGVAIDAGGPGHDRERLRADQPAGGAINLIEEAIFIRLHQNFASAALDRQIAEHHILGCIEIPSIPGRGLVVPDVPAGAGI